MARGQLSKHSITVFEFIKEELVAGRPFPSKRAIAEKIGWQRKSSVNDILVRLVRAGLLRIESRRQTPLGYWCTSYGLVGEADTRAGPVARDAEPDAKARAAWDSRR